MGACFPGGGSPREGGSETPSHSSRKPCQRPSPKNTYKVLVSRRQIVCPRSKGVQEDQTTCPGPRAHTSSAWLQEPANSDSTGSAQATAVGAGMGVSVGSTLGWAAR